MYETDREFCVFDDPSVSLSGIFLKDLVDDLNSSIKQFPYLIKESKFSFFEIKIKDGKQWYALPDLIDNMVTLSAESNAFALIRYFVDRCIESSKLRDDAIWNTHQSNLGQYEATWLAKRNVEDIRLFISFLECCDLGHETSHMSDISDILQKHGWIKETIALWVARIGNCCGQWGHDGWDEEPLVKNWLLEKEDRKKYIETLIACNSISLLRKRDFSNGDLFLFRILERNIDQYNKPNLGLGELVDEVCFNSLLLVRNLVKDRRDRILDIYWQDLADSIFKRRVSRPLIV